MCQIYHPSIFKGTGEEGQANFYNARILNAPVLNQSIWGYSTPVKLFFRISLIWWVGCAFGYQVEGKSNSAANLLLFVFGHTHPSQPNINSAKRRFSTKLIRSKAKEKLVLVATIKAHFVESGGSHLVDWQELDEQKISIYHCPTIASSFDHNLAGQGGYSTLRGGAVTRWDITNTSIAVPSPRK